MADRLTRDWSSRDYRWAQRERAWLALYGPQRRGRFAAHVALDALRALGLNQGEEARVRRIIAELDDGVPQ